MFTLLLPGVAHPQLAATEALQRAAVLLSPDCADPLYRRSVKVSMGAVFSVPYARLDTWPKELETVRNAEPAVVAYRRARSLNPTSAVFAR